MIPQNLSLPSPQSCALETVLSLQHVSRISEVLMESWSGHSNLTTQGASCWLTDESDLSMIKELLMNVSWVSTLLGSHDASIYSPSTVAVAFSPSSINWRKLPAQRSIG